MTVALETVPCQRERRAAPATGAQRDPLNPAGRAGERSRSDLRAVWSFFFKLSGRGGGTGRNGTGRNGTGRAVGRPAAEGTRSGTAERGEASAGR